MAIRLPTASLPVNGKPAWPRRSWSSPPSPSRPCRTGNTTSAARTSCSWVSRGPSSRRFNAASCAVVGASRSTAPVSNSASRSGVSTPVTVSTTVTSKPAARRAETTWVAPASATSRSGVEPPVRTATRITACKPPDTVEAPTAPPVPPTRGVRRPPTADWPPCRLPARGVQPSASDSRTVRGR